MKKSKILQNSRDLISRSFNPSKCKTSLRLAGSRLKLLRNKKEVQIKQMKREIAKLLESGQDQTARIRVEHVVREEKMMAAYDLLEIYCELVVVRLPVIESQKNCPIDLKEAIASLVFSAPRCGDVPELLDAKKQFTAKYGKDFTTAAIELRPQCGVGRMLVEKLSATAPDGQTKTKILSAIAEEHNVKWDPKSFGVEDYTSPNDLLSGSSSFTKESEQYAEHPHFEAAQVQARPSNNVMHSSPSNFSQQDDSTPVGPEKLVSAQTPGDTTQFQSESRPPALGNERAQEDRNSSSLDNPMGKHRWNMEFKDATSAAQAAAESAERASMAARAAAELASHDRISRQYSTEPHKYNVDILNDEGPKAHPNSELSDASIDKLPSERTRLQNEHIKEIKLNDAKIAHKYSQSASFKSKISADYNSLDHGTAVVNEYSRNNSSKDVYNDETKAEKQPLRYEVETANSWPEKSEKDKEERSRKQHSRKSSGSQSTISDDVNIFSNSDYQRFENESGDNPFVGSDKIGSIDEAAPQTSSHESEAISFDKYDSDVDDHGFDKGPSGPTYDEQELDFHLSFGQKSPERQSVDTDSWSRRSSSSKIVNSSSSLFFTKEKSSSDLSENTTLRNDSKLNSAPVTFDESDGPVSESDEDINTRHNKLYDSRDVRKQDEIRQSETGQFSSDDEFSSSLELKRNQVTIFDTDSPEKLGPAWPSATDQPASRPKESKRIDNESDSDSGGRLNFGKLTGGLRHKRHNHLPFVKNRSDASSSSSSVKKGVETTDMVKTSIPIEIDTVLDHKKGSRTQYMHSESDSDRSSEEEESSPKNSGRIQAHTPLKDVKIKPKSFFGTYNSDSDEDFPNVSLSGKSHVRSGISRRTKASPSASKDESHTKARLRSEALDSDAGIARMPTTTNSVTPNKPESKRNNSSKWETYERPTSSGAAKSSTWGRLEQPMSAEATSITKQESEIGLRSEAHDSDTRQGKKPSKSSYSTDNQQEFESIPMKLASKPTKPSSLEPKLEKAKISQKPSIVEEPKAETSIGGENTSSSKDESAKKASHVHPKLPDYDTLFQSLRMNRS